MSAAIHKVEFTTGQIELIRAAVYVRQQEELKQLLDATEKNEQEKMVFLMTSTNNARKVLALINDLAY